MYLSKFLRQPLTIGLISLLGYHHIQAQHKQDIHTILRATQDVIGGCDPSMVTTILSGKTIEGVSFPSHPHDFFLYLYDNNVAVSLEGCFVPISQITQCSIKDNVHMLHLMYPHTKNIPHTLLEQTFYIVRLSDDLEQPTAWTQTISINTQTIKKMHMEYTFYQQVSNKNNNQAVANEFVHFLIDMSDFHTDSMMQHSNWCDQLQITYDIYNQGEQTDHMIKQYVEDFCSRALAIQDLSDENEWSRVLDLMGEEMVLNFTGLRFDSKLLEASLLLHLLHEKYPHKPHYANEDALVTYLGQTLEDKEIFTGLQADFPDIYTDIHSLDIAHIQKVFADKFVDLQKHGITFRTH